MSSPAAVRELLSCLYGLTGTLTRLPSENVNYAVATGDGRRFVLKLADADYPSAMVDLEHVAVERAVAAGIDLQLPRLVATRDGSGPGRCRGVRSG